MVETLDERAARLGRLYSALDTTDMLAHAIDREFYNRISLISSFGTESALLLALVAEVNPDLPVLFIDTGKLFTETLAYRDRLATRLGLTDVRTIEPVRAQVMDRDPEGTLWQFDTDACCQLRKVEPLVLVQDGFDALISGRKRYHGALRRLLKPVEVVDGRLKLDPLASWSQERVAEEFARRNLPQHPLKARGYPSVGCEPCTAPVGDGAAVRAGRWQGLAKTECGIHLSSHAA